MLKRLVFVSALLVVMASKAATVMIEKPKLRWLFGGFGFQNAESRLTPLMSDEFRYERAVKCFHELEPQFSRIYVGMAGESKESLDRFADYYDETLKVGDTTIYAVGGVLPAFADEIDPEAHAEGVAKSLEYLIKKRGCRKIRYYCLTNELMSGDHWGYFWFQKKMPLFEKFHEALYRAFRRHGLEIGLAASDGSYSRSQAQLLKWTVENMDPITEIYCTHYYDGVKPGALENYGIFTDVFTNVVQLALSKNKRWMLGEFGVMPPRERGVMMDDRNWNGYDPEQAPIVALSTAEMAMAAVNAGAYAIMSWSFCDYPDPFIAEDSHDPWKHACYESAKALYKPDMKYNKWGVFRWCDVRKDYGPNPTYFTIGMMSKYFRKGATVLKARTDDDTVRVTALENPDGTMTAAIVNWGEAKTVSIAGWDSFPRLPRVFEYDSAKPYANPFCDLPPSTGTLSPAAGKLNVRVPAKGMVFVTTDYRLRTPAPVNGIALVGTRLTWAPIDDKDHCYYRVYHQGRQIRSTVATSCEAPRGAPLDEFQVVSVDRWGNSGDVLQKKTLVVTGAKPYLMLPVRTDPMMCTTFDRNVGFGRLDINESGVNRLSLTVDAGRGPVSWHSPIDLSDYAGRTLELVLHNADQFAPDVFDGFRCYGAADLPKDLYREPYRPQFHFTPKFGWSNDPNGFSYYRGKWHLFYQSVAGSTIWRPSNAWRHAVSDDLLYWTEVKTAIDADAEAAAFSGSAVTDLNGDHVLVYTRHHWGRSHEQAIARSKDGVNYEKGPTVLPRTEAADRDPFVFRHAPSDSWVQVLFLETNRVHTLGVYVSKDLRQWELASTIPGDSYDDPDPRRFLHECPLLAEVPVEGTDEKRWLVAGASMAYRIGTFDGRAFTPETDVVTPFPQSIGPAGRAAYYKPYYAGQVFNGAPDGRVVYMPWYKLETAPDARFSQGLGLPLEFTLAKTSEGLRLRFLPIRELQSLRTGAATDFAAFRGELAEIEYSAMVGKNAKIAFDLRGVKLVYDAAKGTLSVGTEVSVPWKATAGRFAIRAYLDRIGIEVFELDGFQVLPDPTAKADLTRRDISVKAEGLLGDAEARVWDLKSLYGE